MIPVFVINLDRSPDRRAHMTAQLDSLGIGFERLAAVDGSVMPEAERSAFAAARPRDGKKGWMPGQIGCFLSHLSAWTRIAEGEYECGLVLEDDLHVSPSLPTFLQDGDWLPKSADIVRLESTGQWQKIGARSPVFGRTLGRTLSTAWCAGAYILTRQAAARLMNLPPVTHRPTDFMLFDRSEETARDLETWQIYPALCIQDKMNTQSGNRLALGSDIETVDMNHGSRMLDIRRWVTSTLLGKTRIGFQ